MGVKAGVLAAIAVGFFAAACGGSGEQTSSTTTTEQGAADTSTTSADDTTTTTAAPADHISFAITTLDEWGYTIELDPGIDVSFTKDVSNSPPGRAALLASLDARPSGSIEGDTPGRNAPPLGMDIALSYPLSPEAFDVGSYVGYTNTIGDTASRSGMGCRFWQGGPSEAIGSAQRLGCQLLGEVSSSGTDGFGSASGVLIEGVESDIDLLVRELSAMKPTLVLSLRPTAGDIGCTLYVHPDGSSDAPSPQDCATAVESA